MSWQTRQESRKRRLIADPTIVEHGTESTYNNWSCRCSTCVEAHTERTRSYRNRKRNLGY